MNAKTLDQHIEITPGVCRGKPRISGHRITVQQIAIWHEKLGKSADEIVSENNIQLSDVYAALAYHFDHWQEMDKSLEETSEWIDELRQQTPSLIKKNTQPGSSDD